MGAARRGCRVLTKEERALVIQEYQCEVIASVGSVVLPAAFPTEDALVRLAERPVGQVRIVGCEFSLREDLFRRSAIVSNRDGQAVRASSSWHLLT